jgi:hypothetical protein
MLESFFLRELRTLRLELEAFPDERLIWALPPGLPNSSGTLALHLAGNLQHYIGAVLGQTGYVRDRDYEFAARDLPREALLAQIARAEAAIRATLPGLSEDQLSQEYPEALRGHFLQTREFLLQLAVHLAYHLGQISYHRRLVTGNAQGVGALSPVELTTARPDSRK